MKATGTRTDELADFVGELRRRGYNVGAEQCVMAERLLVALAALGDAAARPHSLATLLAPVLCTSRAEQEEFPHLFQQWLSLRPGLFAPPRESVEIRELPLTIPPPPPPPPRETRRKLPFITRRHFLLTLLTFAAGILTLGLIFYVQITRSPTLSGTVRSQAGEPLANAVVNLQSKQRTGVSYSAVTGSDGSFVITYQNGDLPALLFVYKGEHISIHSITQQTTSPVQVSHPTFFAETGPPAAPSPAQSWTWRDIFTRENATVIAATALISTLAYFLLAWLLRAGGRMELRRWRTRNQLKVFELRVRGAAEHLNGLLPLRRAAQEMRRHRAHASHDLDVGGTIERTLREGLFTPSYAARRSLPEYLVLIDRADAADQHARLVGEIMERLARNDVYVERYFFQGDPRQCRKDEPEARFVSLRELAALYPDHHLVVCGDAAGFFHPLTGRPQRWLEQFAPWASRVLLTPEFYADDYRKRALSESGFGVLPAGKAGLLLLGESAEGGTPPGVREVAPAEPLPEMLRTRPARWLESSPPDPADLRALGGQLKQFLGAEGYFWLSACAVYPQLLWELTFFFGALTVGADRFEESFARLLRLPWFRGGQMPDWLREFLIWELRPEEERRIRAALYDLLKGSLENPEGFVLPLALRPEAGESPLLGRLRERVRRAAGQRDWAGLFKDLRKTEPEDSPLRDYVLVDFMSGRKPRRLSLQLPDELRPVLYPRAAPVISPSICWVLLLNSATFNLIMLLTGVLANNALVLAAHLIACVLIAALYVWTLHQLAEGWLAPETRSWLDRVRRLAADPTYPFKALARAASSATSVASETWYFLRETFAGSSRPGARADEIQVRLQEPELPPPADAPSRTPAGAAEGLAGHVQEYAMTVAARLHGLPPPPPDFTDRAFELAELLREIEQGANVVGLHGPDGIGKTALALKLAEQLAPRYPDAQFYLCGQDTENKRPLTPSEALAHVLRAFHSTAKLPEGEAELQAHYQSVLSGRRALIILDDAHSDEQVASLIPPPGCLLVVASRRQLELPGLFTLSLHTLPLDAARTLLLKIAPNIEKQAADEITRLCGGYPLALRLAAGALSRGTLTAAEYARRLWAFQHLASPDLPEALLNFDQEHLDAITRRRWGILAIFPASFDSTAAAAVWDADLPTAQRTLYELAAFGLLGQSEKTGRRYRLHELARRFAESRLSFEEKVDAQERHARYYANLLTDANKLYLQGGEARERGLALFDEEWLNIEAGQAWADRFARAVPLAADLLVDYAVAGASLLGQRLSVRERAAWLNQALNVARKIENLDGEATCLTNLGRLYEESGGTHRAAPLYEQALAIFRRLYDRPGEAVALGNLGRAYAALGELGRAAECYEELVDITRATYDRGGTAAALGALGRVYLQLGADSRAVECLFQQLNISSEIGDARAQWQSRVMLGVAHAKKGYAARAVEFYERALAIARELGDRAAESIVLGNLGLAYTESGDAERAIEFYEQRVALSRSVGDRQGEASALFNFAAALDKFGRRAQAVKEAEAALRIFEEIGSPLASQVRERLALWRGAGEESF